MSMKRVLILLGFALFSVLIFAQNKFYLSVKDVYIHRGDSLSKVVLEKRTKNQLMCLHLAGIIKLVPLLLQLARESKDGILRLR